MAMSQAAERRDGDFDIAAAFADFLADQTQSELALPPMTTEQRKEAKRLAEQYSELKCESFGFGEERRLHLFKQLEGGAASEGLTRTGSEKSTSASEDVQNGTALDQVGSLVSELIQVRNTFIHVEDEVPIDQRMVQSMPHGMFGKCWEEEVVQKMTGLAKKKVEDAGGAVAENPPCKVTVPPPAKEAPRGIFAPGSDVVVEGLTKCPAFNGLSGKVQSLDKDTGRYDVLLISNTGYQLAKIKGENLRIAVPPPPAQRPEDFGARAPEVSAPMTMCGGFQMPSQPCWYEQHMQPYYAQPDPYVYAPVCPAR